MSISFKKVHKVTQKKLGTKVRSHLSLIQNIIRYILLE